MTIRFFSGSSVSRAKPRKAGQAGREKKRKGYISHRATELTEVKDILIQLNFITSNIIKNRYGTI